LNAYEETITNITQNKSVEDHIKLFQDSQNFQL